MAAYFKFNYLKKFAADYLWQKLLAVLRSKSSGVVPNCVSPPTFHKVDNFSRWGSRMECSMHRVPEELRTAMFFSSLDDSVYGTVTSLGLNPMTDLKQVIACLKTKFEPSTTSVLRD